MAQPDDATIARFLAGDMNPAEIAALDRLLDEDPQFRQRVVDAVRAKESQPSKRTAAEIVPLDPLIGTVLVGRYQVLRKLGGGGMGSVYEAEHALIGRRVALKVLHPQWAANPDVVRRFQNEARAAGTLGHPAIIQALDMGKTDSGMPFLVLELLEGRDLDAELASRGPLPVARAVELGMKIADALSAAHAAGIVHRDLKPENVFLTKDGGLKVLDFGISKIASTVATGPATAPGAMMGTPMYMAPEQFEDAGLATPRADVYALGVVLYRALTGQLPFEKPSLQALLLAIVGGQATPIPELREDVPDGLADAVAKAMSPEPSDRFESMEAMSEALAPYAQTESRASIVTGDAHARRVATVLATLGVRDEESARRVIEDAGGRVGRGDGSLLGVFGERTWQGDEAVRAVAAGLSLRALCESTAVASGHVQRDGERVSGYAVDRALEACAARLEGVAVVSPSTRLESSFELRRVSGELAEATAQTRTGWSWLAQSAEGQPLLGRAAEIAQLTAALEQATLEQRAVTVWLTGDPGLGKSRLCAELIRIASEYGEAPVTLVARGQPGGVEQRSVIADAIASRAHWGAFERGWPRLDGAVEDRRAAVHLLAREVSTAPAELSGFLGELLGVAMPATSALGAARGNARLMSDRLDLAVREYFDQLTNESPVVLIFEDLQWADSQSLVLLDQLTSDVALDRPLLVVGTARAEHGSDVAAPFDTPETVSLKLRGLSLTDVHALGAWLTGQELPPPFAKALLERTGGNPLFLEQTLVALREEGRDLGEAVLESLPIPADVEAAIQARLEALPETGQAVLRAATALGGPATREELHRILGILPELSDLQHLERAGLLRRRRGGGSTRWELRTTLIADVVNRWMSDEVLQSLHLKAAAALLEAESAPDSEAVAVHFERAAAKDDAAVYYHRAALSAARHLDTPKVLRCADRALSLGAPAGGEFSLKMAVADALEAEGKLKELDGALERAEGTAQTPGERARVAMARGLWSLRSRGAPAAVSIFERAVTLAREDGDGELLGRALGRLATARVYSGEHDLAVGILSEAELVVMTRAPSLAAEVATWKAQLAGVQGDLGARRNAYLAATQLYASLGDQRNLAGASINLADVLNRFGDYAAAEAALGDAREAARALRLRLYEGYALTNRGYARMMTDRLAASEDDLNEALRVVEETGDARLRVFTRLYRARLSLLRGELRAAAEGAGEVLALGAPLELKTAMVLAHAIRARAALEANDAGSALAAAEEAMTLRRELGGLEEGEPELFATYARALDLAGRGEEAARTREEASRSVELTAMRIADPELRQRYLTAHQT